MPLFDPGYEVVPPSGVRIELLGTFLVRIDGQILELPAGGRRLVAYLALSDRPLTRRVVAGALWPASAGARALATLRTTLYRLNLRRSIVRSVEERLAFLPGTSCDVDEAMRWADRVIGGRAGTDDLAAEPPVSHELLAGWDDDWVLLERERLRQRLLHGTEALVGELSAVGRHADAVAVALAAVVVDPLRESAHRAVIAAHLAEGNTADAVRQYRRFSSVLQSELGLAPTEGLQRFVQQGVRRGSAPIAVSGAVRG